MVIAFLMMNPFHHSINPIKNDRVRGGEYNGYVAFDGKLPLSWQGGADYDEEETLDNMVSVHGGITFDHSAIGDLMDNGIIPITSIPDPKSIENFRVIGFDTLHCDDTPERWPIEAVKEETIQLMEQIEKLLEK